VNFPHASHKTHAQSIEIKECVEPEQCQRTKEVNVHDAFASVSSIAPIGELRGPRRGQPPKSTTNPATHASKECKCASIAEEDKRKKSSITHPTCRYLEHYEIAEVESSTRSSNPCAVSTPFRQGASQFGSRGTIELTDP